MLAIHKKDHIFVLLFLSIIFFLTCKNSDNGNNITDPNNGNDNIYDVIANGIPKFVNTNYIQLNKIKQISRFRSSVGHSYTDDFETCRSMKHYFMPKNSVNWSGVKIFSPITGTVVEVRSDNQGSQVRIQYQEKPAFFFILFHVNIMNPTAVGDTLTEGQQLGTHISANTFSDIAVGVNTPEGWKLVSYFDVMTDALFQTYQARGATSRGNLIISQAARDADPLTCNGEQFVITGNLANWFVLN